MSSKRPNLTIEIQQPGQEFNSKFKGYIQDPISTKSLRQHQYQYQLNYSQSYVPGVEMKNSQISETSEKSKHSRDSQRSMLFERAQQVILENRLAQNVKSLSKGKWKKVDNGRRAVGIRRIGVEGNEKNQGSSGSEIGDLEIRRRFFREKQQIVRSKSAAGLENSRAKLLQQIAQKLGKASRVHTSHDEQNHSLIGNSQIKSQQSQTKSRVEKIKQIKQQMQKTRGGKLEHLLKDIKKSNKQSYKVVYTIKKSIKSGSKKNGATPLTDRVAETGSKQDFSQIKGYLSPNGVNLFDVPQPFRHQHIENKGNMNSQLSNLAIQLQNVRFELKQVKNHNDQLLQMSKNRQNYYYSQSKLRNTQDQGSQSSRLTNKMLEFDLASLDSSTKNNGAHYINTNAQSIFAKGLPVSMQYPVGERSGEVYHIVRQPVMIQACFACGCSCMKGGK